MRKIIILILISAAGIFAPLNSQDWPIYKGNIYFTGNNDEITVKNNNLKWLYQASQVVLNPIASDGMIFFLDLSKNVYCLDEETGKLRWKNDLKVLSSQFRSSTMSFGKAKYPLIKGDRLFITDNIALFCLNKFTGRVIWARTGMRSDDANLKIQDHKKTPMNGRNPVTDGRNWNPEKSTYAMVDSIYSDPVIVEDIIYYGTRNEFMSREIVNGHMLWRNDDIKSWSRFPSFYDEFIFTQSMDYKTNTYTLLCIIAKTGEIKWKKEINSPHRIFPPVVYRQRVYMASGENMYAIDLNDGSLIWGMEYPGLITSNPAFTERAVLFTLNNSSIMMIDPDKGKPIHTLDFGEQTAPYFVTIRDHIYAATTFSKNISGRGVPWARLQAFNIIDGKALWEYSPQFPGAPSQPVASKGILFLPAGNYLYAIGTDYYPKIVDGGSGYYDPYNRAGEEEDITRADIDDLKKINEEAQKQEKKSGSIPMRNMKINVDDSSGGSIPAVLEIKKWDRGKLIYSENIAVKQPGEIIKVPDMDDVEITASSDGYLPEKIIVSRKDDEKNIKLNRLERGRGIIVENIHFEVNQAHLRKESLNILDSIIAQMKKNRGIKLEVRGHTDSTGGKAYNQKLSERRADAVVEYMIKQGISPERLKPVGMGQNKPVADNKTATGRKKNRRTEFFVLEK
jgi:outer membrane protein OmpA-like peptidoglycan-associated protein/outer membrane protein assembly factor BamB